VTRLTAVAILLLAPAAHPSGPAAKGVRFNCGPSGKPSASVHIAQLATKPSKHGFLRIATIPIVSASGVEMRVKDPSSNFLADFSEYIASLTKSQTFEFQNVSIHVGNEKSPRVTAQSVTVSQKKWDLKNVRIPSHEKNRLFPSVSIDTAVSPILIVPQKSQSMPIQDILTTVTP
jgi:hypothetical protein